MDEDQSNELFYDMMKVYLAQTNSALKISKIISEHSDRNELSGNDIICGLIYRLMNPMEQSEIDDNLSVADELLKEDSEEEEEEYDEIEETYVKPTLAKQIKSNNCNCDVCMKMRVDLINYHSFEPNDQLSQMFKGSIDITCEKYNIYI
jgi:hypothetical protein